MTDRRKALGLGLAASALALSGRGKARAADALTIDPGGVRIDNLTVAKSLTVDGATNLGNVSVSSPLIKSRTSRLGTLCWVRAESHLNMLRCASREETLSTGC